MSQPSNPFASQGELRDSAALNDLPPVEAPSAGFIVQLFVIPAVVVLVVICVWLLFGKLAGGERDAMEYVRLIRAADTNWRAANRAAFELASLIQNDPRLGSDPKLLGELTDILDSDLDKAENPEITEYLALAIGRFQTLNAVAKSGKKIDPLATLAKALAPKEPEAIRIAAAASLAKHAARLEGKLDDPKAVSALAEASHATQPDLRQMAVYALGFFPGEEGANALRESLNDENRFVRYNAAIALARRADPACIGTMREMLSTAHLEKAVTLESPSAKEHKIEAIELESLLALQTALKEGHPDFVKSFRTEVTALSQSGLAGVRSQALDLLREDRPVGNRAAP
jgi:hypothetical protein